MSDGNEFRTCITCGRRHNVEADGWVKTDAGWECCTEQRGDDPLCINCGARSMPDHFECLHCYVERKL
jgi:hypothetical protein